DGQTRGEARGIPSVCSAHPVVLKAAFERALEDGSSVLVEATSNQVNPEGGYSGMTPGAFASFVGGLADEASLPRDRVILGGDHLGPHPWRARPAAVAMACAAETVRQYVGAGCAKVHLDASMACADDPAGLLAEEVAAARTAELAAAAEAALGERPPGAPPPLYVVGTEVPSPGGQAGPHGGPVPTCADDAERTLALTRAAFARLGVERAFERVVAVVVQPGVEFGDDVVFRYPGGRADLSAVAARHGLVFEAHSTDYQDEGALRALVRDRFAILKVGPELTFALRASLFALEAIERELLSRTKVRLSGLRQALDRAMRGDPRHWREFYRDADAGARGLKRAFSLSDRCRYYWPVPAVREARERLLGNLGGRRVPRGLLEQHFPDTEGVLAGDEPDLPARLERLRVRRVLDRYARACRRAPVSNGPRFP
ncbi:MAG TPA: class II D-tagatose-bisphosphate aldolase, non-catalytic subunit, partial [Vicinamibacteria bacterium]